MGNAGKTRDHDPFKGTACRLEFGAGNAEVTVAGGE
jgi:hypothetical protein